MVECVFLTSIFYVTLLFQISFPFIGTNTLSVFVYLWYVFTFIPLPINYSLSACLKIARYCLTRFPPPCAQDESHFLKNIKTARCKAALPLLKV